MYLDSYVNQKIQLKLRNFPEELTGDITGIYKPSEWILAKLVSTDSYGLWVENPCYKRVPVRDKDGVSIPEEDQVEEVCTSNMLVRWEHISSVITFPNETTIGLDKKVQLIGFHPDMD